MELLEEEIVRSIYYDYDKHDKYDRSNTRQLFSAITYDKKAKQYMQDIVNLQAKSKKFEEDHAEIVKDIKSKSFQVEQSIKQWHNQSLHTSFRAWATYVTFKKTNLAKTQKIFERWVLNSSDLLRKVFHGWKIFRQQNQQEKIARGEQLSRQKFEEIQEALVSLRLKTASGNTELERETKQLADLKIELEERSAELADAQNRLAGSVDREAAVLDQALIWAELARTIMPKCIEEFQLNLDAATRYQVNLPLHDQAFSESGGANQWVNYWLAKATHPESISSVRLDMNSKIFGILLKQLKLGIDATEAKLNGQAAGGRRSSAAIVLIDTDEEKQANLVVDFATQLLEQLHKLQAQIHGDGALSGT